MAQKPRRKTKHPSEAFNVGFLYTAEDLPEGGVTITSSVVTVTQTDTQDDVTSTIAPGSTTVDQGGLRHFVELVAGVSGKEYLVDYLLTLTNGQVFVDQVLLTVDDNNDC